MNKEEFRKLDTSTQLWLVYEKLEKGGGSNEWKEYYEKRIKKFNNPDVHDKTHRSDIQPISGPLISEKCHCTNNHGTWGHIMHSGDPLENCMMDILIETFDKTKKIDQIMEKLEKSPPGSASGNSTDISEILKVLKELQNYLQ